MSRNMTMLFVLLIVIMMGAIGFLAMQVSDLNDLYYATKNTEQSDALSSEEIAKKLASFKNSLNTQQETMVEFSSSLTQVKKDLKGLTAKQYMPAPEYVPPRPVFKTEGSTDNKITVVGDKSRFNRWLSDNEIFLDYVVKKSLPLEYDRSRRQVVIQNMIPNSLFYQMGFRKGDGLLSINGKLLNRGPDIRQELIELKKKQIVIMRGKKRMTIDVSFESGLTDEVSLNITKKQFDAAVAKFVSSLKLAPALKDGDILGVKIIDIANSPVFTLMKFQSQDILTKVNGDTVNENKLVSSFQTATDPIEIDYLRDDKPGRVVVLFREN